MSAHWILDGAGLSVKFQVAGSMQLVEGELYRKEVLLVLFLFCFLQKLSGLTLIVAKEHPQALLLVTALW